MLVKAGMDFDDSVIIVDNELQRTLALIATRGSTR